MPIGILCGIPKESLGLPSARYSFQLSKSSTNLRRLMDCEGLKELVGPVGGGMDSSMSLWNSNRSVFWYSL